VISAGAVRAAIGVWIVEDDGELTERVRRVEGFERQAAGIARAVAVAVLHAADVGVAATACDRGERIVAIGDAVAVPVICSWDRERVGESVVIRVERARVVDVERRGRIAAEATEVEPLGFVEVGPWAGRRARAVAEDVERSASVARDDANADEAAAREIEDVTRALERVVEPHEIAAGSGLATFVRTLGGSFAASLTTYAWAERGAVHHAHLTEKISTQDPTTMQTVMQLGGGDLQRGAMMLERTISNQAAQIAFNEIFHLLGIIFLCVIVFVWIAKPPFAAKLGGAPPGGGH